MIEWTREEIMSRSNGEVASLRENAARIGRQDIVDLCDDELIRRKPVRERKLAKSTKHDRSDQYVCEFHFVCPSELEVVRNPDGTIWTGTWVVAEEHADKALKHGAVVALHTSKAEPSYLQGPIKGWRKSPRQPHYTGEQLTQTEEGIDFLFEPSGSPLPWKGNATGEKGYLWAPLSK